MTMSYAVGSPYTNELHDALGRAGAVLRAARASATAIAFADDPLRLDLPPLLDGSSRVSAQTLRLTGTLYLQSELEQSGLVVAAEGLVGARDLLQARAGLAGTLEEFADAMRGAGASIWLLGDHAPDSGRHAARAAAGQTLFLWLAGVVPAIDGERNTTLVPRNNPVFAAAARWMVASGLSLPRGAVL